MPRRSIMARRYLHQVHGHELMQKHGAASPARYGCRQGAAPKHHRRTVPRCTGSDLFASQSLLRGSVVHCCVLLLLLLFPGNFFQQVTSMFGKRFWCTRTPPHRKRRIESEDVDPWTWNEGEVDPDHGPGHVVQRRPSTPSTPVEPRKTDRRRQS